MHWLTRRFQRLWEGRDGKGSRYKTEAQFLDVILDLLSFWLGSFYDTWAHVSSLFFKLVVPREIILIEIIKFLRAFNELYFSVQLVVSRFNLPKLIIYSIYYKCNRLHLFCKLCKFKLNYMKFQSVTTCQEFLMFQLLSLMKII